MEASRRLLVWTGLALGLGLLVLFALPSYRQGEASIAGKSAEDFALTIDGKENGRVPLIVVRPEHAGVSLAGSQA